MFAKSFRVKSNAAIKGSDRRRLQADVAVTFPDVDRERIPGRKELSIMRLCLYKGNAATVYVSGRNPVFFEVEKNLYPTVYTLWAYPDLLPAFTTWPTVLRKLAGGADFLLPEIVVPSGGLPVVKQGDLCAIALVGNRAPVAIAVAKMSSAEMLASDLKGKGFTVLHTYLDCLWHIGDRSSPPTVIPLDRVPPELEENAREEGAARGNPVVREQVRRGKGIRVARENPPVEAAEGSGVAESSQASTSDKSLQEQMDELLRNCFFHALKSRVTEADLPLLTSTFLGSHMFSCCPRGQQLDMKKSSYRKLSKFLHQMMKQQILQLKELSKGVESIVSVDWKHPSITSFIVPKPAPDYRVAQKVRQGERSYYAPEIKSLYCVPARMSALFQDSGFKRGSILSAREVRRTLWDYVQRNKLVDAECKDFVKLDSILCDCLLGKSEQFNLDRLPWDNLFARCLGRLQSAYKVTFYGQEPVVKKGKIYPIEIILAQRAFNKKVTLIRNLKTYGLDPYDVAALLKQRGQTSATVSQIPQDRNAVQVQIQGNQISLLSHLLLEEYCIPAKYIYGLEKAFRAYKN
ncbi:eukaryotic translation initiation factor 2D-like [Sarcophilus harrisii]